MRKDTPYLRIYQRFVSLAGSQWCPESGFWITRLPYGDTRICKIRRNVWETCIRRSLSYIVFIYSGMTVQIDVLYNSSSLLQVAADTGGER